MDLTALFLNFEPPGQSPKPSLESCDELVARVSTPIRRVDRLDEQKILELATGYLAGSNVSELVRQYQVHETTVRAHLKRSGVELRRFRKMSPAVIVEARVLRASGMSLTEIGARFGVTANTVKKVLAEEHLDLDRGV